MNGKEEWFRDKAMGREQSIIDELPLKVMGREKPIIDELVHLQI
jgi:hypothetical protein